MELKHHHEYAADRVLIYLLIVPYGIETSEIDEEFGTNYCF